MIDRVSPGADARLAVLSYHSWDVTPEVLSRDIRALRGGGWRFVSANEAKAFVYGRHGGRDTRLALVTTDDGHVEDVEFRDTLRGEDCPAVTFVNVGRMDPERFPWYQSSHSEDWSVEDHGPLHRRHFISGHLTGVFHGQKIGGLEYLGLPLGAPLLASASQFSSPRFEPDPDAIAAAARWAGEVAPAVIATPEWLLELSRRLLRARLAKQWRGRTYVLGTVESDGDYARRVAVETAGSRAAFEKALGRAPAMFSYPWWQGSAACDRELARSGYTMSFAGTGRMQGATMPPYSIPRIALDRATTRPLDLSHVAMRTRHDWGALRRRVEGAAKRVIGVV